MRTSLASEIPLEYHYDDDDSLFDAPQAKKTSSDSEEDSGEKPLSI